MLVSHACRMPVDVTDERLRARVGHLNRQSRPQRQHASVCLHREVLACAERAPDAGHRQPDVCRRQPKAIRELVAVDVQPLGGDVEVDAAVTIRDRKSRLWAEGRLVLHADLVLRRDHHVRVRVLVASPDLDLSRDIAVWVQPRSVIGERNLGVRQRFEHVVLDPHRLRRTPRQLGVISSDERDRLTPIAHHVRREHRLVEDLQSVEVAPGYVLVREHGAHAGHRQRFARVDRDDARVRMRAPNRRSPEHAIDLQVGRIWKIAARLEGGVGPADRVTDAAGHDRRRRQPRPRRHLEAILSAARCTASMTLE